MLLKFLTTFQGDPVNTRRLCVAYPTLYKRHTVQRLSNVVQTSLTFGQRWADVVETSRVH